jgi:hypothetical protein
MAKTCYGRDTWDLPYEERTEIASDMYGYMKTRTDFIEENIALFLHASGKYMVDCNADTTTVYKAEEDGSFYTGDDGFYALISDTDGIKEWIGDEGLDSKHCTDTQSGGEER